MFGVFGWPGTQSRVPYRREIEDLDKERDDLEKVLNDVDADPIPLSYNFLRNITDDFSKERKIGKGGFGVVYMGVLRQGNVAVKMLSRVDDFSEQQFEDELTCLMSVKHKNIVRCLGYCSETKQNVVNLKGKLVLAEVRRRFLCFEYVPKKSLKENLTVLREKADRDEWDTHFQLIEGICQGLRYLHSEQIIHLDLTPGNILIDDDMVPKISDFGLSRRFGADQSKIITKNVKGIMGYLAPEYISMGELSFKSDVYALGMIFMNILCGSKDVPDFKDWHKALVIDNLEVKRSIWIAQHCVNFNKHRRPTMDAITNMLDKETVIEMGSPVFGRPRSLSEEFSLNQMMQSPDGLNLRRIHSTEEISPAPENRLFSAEPLELRFNWKPKHLMSSCSLHLTNNTDDHVAFRIRMQNLRKYFLGPLHGLVLPRSSYTLHVTMSKKIDRSCSMTLESTKAGDSNLPENNSICQYNSYFVEAKKNGGEVQQVKLTAMLVQQPGNTLIQEYGSDIKLINVHPTETCRRFHFHMGLSYTDKQLLPLTCSHTLVVPLAQIISAYKRKKNVDNPFRDMISITRSNNICSSVFIAKKKWFLTGSSSGYLSVYSYETMRKVITSIKYQNWDLTSLAIHPTKPYILLASVHERKVIMLNWEEDWSYIEGYQMQESVRQVKFNPKYEDYFGCVSTYGLEIWNIGSSSSREFILARNTRVLCFDYFTRGDELYVITGHADGSVNIWDYQSRARVKVLREHAQKVQTVCGHPDLPVLITGSDDGTVRLWNSGTYRDISISLRYEPARALLLTGKIKPEIQNTAVHRDGPDFRLEGMLSCGLGKVRAIACLNGSNRIVIGHEKGLFFTDI